MHVSEARIAANRKNALKSTGPRTPEGKAASRANSLKHGLCSSIVMAEDARVVTNRAQDFFDTLRPQNHFHCWLVNEISLTTFKIERAERMDRRARDKIAIRAEETWDADRRVEAELLGGQLANRPAVVLDQLKKTPQGCEWLIGRWALLAYTADKGAWTKPQERLAFDLLGTPEDFREGNKPGVSIDHRGRVIDPGLDQAAVARREIDALEILRDQALGLDEANRCLAMADLNDDHDPELRRIRKYETSLHTRLRWFKAQLQESGPPRELPRWLRQIWHGYQETTQTPDPPEPMPVVPEATEVPEPAPEWVTNPSRVDPYDYPFELEPDEVPAPGEFADIPKIVEGRRQKRLAKAETRREARRKKAQKILS